MAEFSKTERGVKSLHDNGFQYIVNRRVKGGQTNEDALIAHVSLSVMSLFCQHCIEKQM